MNRFPLARALAGLFLLGALLRPAAAASQGTGLVAPDDLAYDDVLRLVELGMLDGVIIGQRPYSSSEFARMVRVTRDRLDHVVGPHIDFAVDARERAANGILRRLEARFGDAGNARRTPIIAVFDAAALQFTATDAVSRGFPGNLTKATEATITPLLKRRLGRAPLPGTTLALTIQQSLQATDWLTFRARERFETRVPNDTARARRDGEVVLASARARYRNAALTIGREEFVWAQGDGEGLFLASDAPALDQISVASDHPFRLRWVGPTQATLLIADLGTSIARSHSSLLAYKVSVQPHPGVEIGGTFFNHFGGAGGRSVDLADRVVDFLPFVDVFRRHNYVDSTRTLEVDSDKQLGIDGRWRIEQLAGATVTGEVLIDDFDVRRIPQLLTGFGSSQVAILLPSLGSPQWSLKLSARHMGILTYSHIQIANGITTRGHLLGDELGPDAKAFGADLVWRPFTAVRLAMEGRSAIYSDADYASSYADAAQTRYVVRKLESRPDELRDRLLARIEFQSDEGLALVIRGGGERVRNLNFQGTRRNEYLVNMALRLRM